MATIDNLNREALAKAKVLGERLKAEQAAHKESGAAAILLYTQENGAPGKRPLTADQLKEVIAVLEAKVAVIVPAEPAPVAPVVKRPA
jgi:hypothetical protein